MISPINIALRFVVAITLLTVLALRYSDSLTTGVLPLYQWEISVIQDSFRVTDLRVDQQGPDHVVRLEVALAKPVFVGSRYIMPDERGRANATTLVGNVMQSLVTLLTVLLVWPTGQNARPAQVYLLRLGIASPLVLFVLLTDTPLVLLDSIWGIILQHLTFGGFSPLDAWCKFLQGGGRIALGLASGTASVLIAHALLHKAQKAA